MKKTIITAAILMATVVSAWASCPVGSRYQCTPTMSGKMQCGCW